MLLLLFFVLFVAKAVFGVVMSWLLVFSPLLVAVAIFLLAVAVITPFILKDIKAELDNEDV